MLKFEINHGKVELQVMGSMEDTTNEILTLIHLVYTRTHRSNPQVADSFKRVLIGVLLDPAAPVFTPDAAPGNVADICIVTDRPIKKNGQEADHGEQ